MTLRRIITAGAVLALTCLTAPVALANGTGSPPLQAAHYDGRSPDTKDAAAATHAAPAPVIVVGSTSFDWTDAGIGATAGFGLALIAASALALTRGREAPTTT